jgi:D-cysteine desulfhydrase
VVDHHFINKNKVLELFAGTAALLHSLDPVFPRLDPAEAGAEMDIRDRYLGNGYAQFTEEGREAMTLMKEMEGTRLDGTYTGKTFAALMEDAREGRLKGKKVLFWNTLNAHDFSASIGDIDYHQLPKSFHRYFEKDVQPLDRG